MVSIKNIRVRLALKLLPLSSPVRKRAEVPAANVGSAPYQGVSSHYYLKLCLNESIAISLLDSFLLFYYITKMENHHYFY